MPVNDYITSTISSTTVTTSFMFRISGLLFIRNPGSWFRLLRFCDDRRVPGTPLSTPATSDGIPFAAPVTDDAHPRPPTPGHDDGPGGPPRPDPRHVRTVNSAVPDASRPTHWTPCAWYTRAVMGCCGGLATPAGQTVQEYASIDAVKCFCKVHEIWLIGEIARSLWMILFFCSSYLWITVNSFLLWYQYFHVWEVLNLIVWLVSLLSDCLCTCDCMHDRVIDYWLIIQTEWMTAWFDCTFNGSSNWWRWFCIFKMNSEEQV